MIFLDEASKRSWPTTKDIPIEMVVQNEVAEKEFVDSEEDGRPVQEVSKPNCEDLERCR